MATNVLRWIKASLAHNLGLKLLSIIVALSVWFWVNVASPREVDCAIERRVELYNLEDLGARVEVPRERRQVTVVVRGPRLDLMNGLDKVRIWVDLGRARGRVGPVLLPVEPFVPGRLKVVSMEPNELQVMVEAATPQALPPVLPSPPSLLNPLLPSPAPSSPSSSFPPLLPSPPVTP